MQYKIHGAVDIQKVLNSDLGVEALEQERFSEEVMSKLLKNKQ